VKEPYFSCNMLSMATESEEYGYVDLPPQGTVGKNNPPRERKTTYDRPVYSVRPGDDLEERMDSDKINFRVLLIAGILVLAMTGAYFFNVGGLKGLLAGDARSIDSQKATAEFIHLEKEVIKTIGLLEDAEGKFAANPEKLEKIIKLKSEAKDLLNTLQE